VTDCGKGAVEGKHEKAISALDH